MLDWLFPNWSNPAVVAAVVVARTLLNAGLTALVADATGRTSPATLLAGTITVAGTVVVVLVLRPGLLGHRASLVDLLAQVLLLCLGGYAAYAAWSVERALAYAILALATLGVGLVTVPLYGEATVAP